MLRNSRRTRRHGEFGRAFSNECRYVSLPQTLEYVKEATVTDEQQVHSASFVLGLVEMLVPTMNYEVGMV